MTWTYCFLESCLLDHIKYKWYVFYGLLFAISSIVVSINTILYLSCLMLFLFDYDHAFYFLILSCCRMFIDTCKRLRIMKGSDAIGLGEYLLLSPLWILRPLPPHYQNVIENTLFPPRSWGLYFRYCILTCITTWW